MSELVEFCKPFSGFAPFSNSRSIFTNICTFSFDSAILQFNFREKLLEFHRNLGISLKSMNFNYALFEIPEKNKNMH